MKSHFEIINNAKLPKVLRVVTYPSRRLSEEQKTINRKLLSKKNNDRKTKEEITLKNKKAYAKLKTNKEKLLIERQRTKLFMLRKLEKLAGRPKPDNCEICNEKSKICFDHCHNKGNFRGWICDRCNKLLGQAKDDVKILELCIKYLQMHLN